MKTKTKKPQWSAAWLLRDAAWRITGTVWCAVSQSVYTDQPATACGNVVVLPCGFEKRKPTCPECVSKLAAKKSRTK